MVSTRNKIKNIVLLAFILAAFIITVTRAAITNITYDEAFTYMHYSRTLNSLVKSGFNFGVFAQKPAQTDAPEVITGGGGA